MLLEGTHTARLAASSQVLSVYSSTTLTCTNTHYYNKKHLKNVGPIYHCEPPHAHSADVGSGTVARRLRIDFDDNDDDNDNA